MRKNLTLVTKEENRIIAQAMRQVGKEALYGAYANDGSYKCLDIYTVSDMIQELDTITVSSIVNFIVNTNRMLYAN